MHPAFSKSTCLFRWKIFTKQVKYSGPFKTALLYKTARCFNPVKWRFVACGSPTYFFLYVTYPLENLFSFPLNNIEVVSQVEIAVVGKFREVFSY